MVYEKGKTPNEFGTGKAVDEKIVLEGMKVVENEQEYAIQQSQESIAKQSSLGGKLLDTLKQSGFDSKPFTTEVRAIAEKERKARAGTVSDIKFLKALPFFSADAMAATRVPPFDYQWSWEWARNNPLIEKSASTNGQMSFSLWEDISNSSTALARTAVGIYFAPPSQNGQLHVFASPAFRASWATWCSFASAHTDGWIGLFVGAYNASDNSYAGAIIDQKFTMYSDDSWWSGVGWQESSTSGFPLLAYVPVDNSHWYAIWVWSGGRIDAEGWDPLLSGSGAHSGISSNIPFISWAYFG